MDDKMTFPVAFAADDNYLPYMTVAMQSVIHNHVGGGIRFHDMIQNLDFSGILVDDYEIYNDILGPGRYGLSIKFFARGLFLRMLKKFKFV
jgi:hypothetical protein